MKMSTNFKLLFLSMIVALSGIQTTAAQEMPVDPNVRIGVLDNGLTYYIRHNEEPKNRASFYRIQNVGALLENDAQNGLAHFLEHMSFNGTEHFPGKGIINTLQHNGVEFGRNLNAYTSFDETVYNISEVPTTNEALLDTCLLIMNDWCNYLSLTAEEIDAERGVITEEWRTRNNAQSRMWKERMSYLMRGSKYCERDVIGSLDVIQHHKYQTLRDFYHDWYRTDLQAIAIVGDFDVDTMETKVKELFSKIPAVENALERYYVNIPFNYEPIFGLITDKEATSTSINVSFKHMPVPRHEHDINYYRLGIIRSLYAQMFSQRIQEIIQQKEPPFVSARSMYTEYVHNLDLYYIDAGAKKNEEDKALSAIMTENERVKRFGFTPGELKRAKANYLTHFESAYKQRDKISNDSYAREYTRNYLENEPIPGIEREYELVQEMLPGISIDEINDLAKDWISYKHMVVIVTGSDADGITHLTEKQAFSIIDSVRNATIEPYEDKEVATELMTTTPKKSKIVNTKALPSLDAEEWTLKNGIKVVYRYSDIDKDKVFISAQSQGGTSLYVPEDLPSAQMTGIVSDFGLGEYDPISLKKILAGKKVRVRPYVGELSEGVSANGSPKDIKTLFQLLYLTFEQPRFDETIYESKIQQYSTYLGNRKNDPKSAINDSASLILSDYNPRTILFNEDFIKNVSLEKIEKIYKERFEDANDFTFFITGNISKEEVKPLVETYIGGLAVEDGDENWQDNNVEMPKGKIHKEVKIAMEMPKSTVFICYGNNNITYSPENILYAKLLGDILDLRYTEAVREKEGGTYGVSVDCSLDQYPDNEASLAISFDCDPERVKDLTPIIYQEFEKIAKDGPTTDDLNKVIVTSKKNRESAFDKNGFWLSAMRAYYWRGIDITLPSYYEDFVDKISPSDIQNFAKRIIEESDKTEIIFLPEE